MPGPTHTLRIARACLVIAALLSTGLPGVSDVLCVSRSGGVAVEGWSDPCRSAVSAPGAVGVHAPDSRTDCTDYPLLAPGLAGRPEGGTRLDWAAADALTAGLRPPLAAFAMVSGGPRFSSPGINGPPPTLRC